MLRFYLHVHSLLTRPLLPGDDRGVTSVEYALLVALIALAIAGAVTGLATNIGGAFNKVGGVVNPAP
jgi:pilus assembly protein Flp/PilA